MGKQRYLKQVLENIFERFVVISEITKDLGRKHFVSLEESEAIENQGLCV